MKAGKADELKQALAARKGQPMAELPAAILNAQLALAAGRPGRDRRRDQEPSRRA